MVVVGVCFFFGGRWCLVNRYECCVGDDVCVFFIFWFWWCVCIG